MKITRIDHKESMLTTMILEFEHVEEEYDNKTKKIKLIITLLPVFPAKKISLLTKFKNNSTIHPSL